jgi:hypothetical protein
MLESLRGSVDMGTKEEESSTGRVWAPCYGPFLLGARFETDEPFISSIFKIFFVPR